VHGVEFPQLGLTRDELREVIYAWPDSLAGIDRKTVWLAVYGSLNEICNAGALSDDDWEASFGHPKSEIFPTCQRLLSTRETNPVVPPPDSPN